MSYLAVIEHLANHYHCSPDVLTEEQIRQYILARQKKLKPNSMRPSAWIGKQASLCTLKALRFTVQR